MSHPSKTVSADTTTSASGSDSTDDLETMFHHSRLIEMDREITLRPVEILVEYEYTSDTNHDEESDDIPVVDSVEKLPLVNGNVYLDLDNEQEGVVDIETTFYLQMESDDLLADIYIPLDPNDFGERGNTISDIEHFLGKQNMNLQNYLNIDELALTNSEYNAEVNKDVVTFTESEKEVEKYGTLSKKWWPIAKITTNETLYKTIFSSLGLVAIFILFIGVTILPSIYAESMTVGIEYFVGIIMFIFGFTTLADESEYYHKNKAGVNANRYMKYQIGRPTDTETIWSIDEQDAASDDDKSSEVLRVTATIDSESNACVFEAIESDRTWRVSLTNDVMGDELVEFFENVGAEQLDGEFLVERQVYPDQNAIQTEEHGEYLSPVS